MKKFTVLLAIGLLLCAFSTAKADLIGVISSLGYPDISFNNSGFITYNATSDTFAITAQDLKLVMSQGGSQIFLSGPNLNTDISLTITVDSGGNLVGTGIMTEILTEGSITVDGHDYSAALAPVTLLSGTVFNFGWGEGSLVGQFDFLLNNLGGAFINDGIWPVSYPTGIFAYAETLNGWTGSWDNDFRLDKVKGDKASVVPEPATMLLLGSGLLGLAGYGRKKFLKK